MNDTNSTYYIAPHNDLNNEWAAGYSDNSFADREVAEGLARDLATCFDTEPGYWVVVERRSPRSDEHRRVQSLVTNAYGADREEILDALEEILRSVAEMRREQGGAS